MEIWKDIIDYEGLYQVSNLGRVKSLHHNKELILKPAKWNNGYLVVSLWLNGNQKIRRIHQLVAVAFLNHTPCGLKLVINHKDFNKQNNHVSNIELISQRENTNQKHLKSTSKYTGVCLKKGRNKWESKIRINGKVKYLGLFVCEIDAHNAYQNELNKL